mmetsp:Transcript_4386/g.15738  ORF Transcript_4386/g.15738 Transcript_4386/m.15738 type:complete len:269 (+) Transcript_4386:1091-1897(+)
MFFSLHTNHTYSLHGDRFGQVSGLVHVETPEHGEVVAQELERNDVQDGLEAVAHGVHRDDPGPPVIFLAAEVVQDVVVPFAHQEDQPALPGQQLLDRGPHLLPEGVIRGHHHRWHGLVDQREGAVLELPGQDALAVHVAKLLHLERQLQGSGIVVAPAERQQGRLLRKLSRQVLDHALLPQHPAHHGRQPEQVPHDLVPPLALGDRVLAQLQGDHHDHQDLARVSLGARHPDLYAGVDVNPTRRLPGDGRPHRVGDPHAQGTPSLGVL